MAITPTTAAAATAAFTPLAAWMAWPFPGFVRGRIARISGNFVACHFTGHGVCCGCVFFVVIIADFVATTLLTSASARAAGFGGAVARAGIFMQHFFAFACDFDEAEGAA